MAHVLLCNAFRKAYATEISPFVLQLYQWCGFSAALEERVRERVREHERRANSAREDAAAAAASAVGGPCPEVRPQSRHKAAHGGRTRPKARQAAPSPAMQAEKQPAKSMPVRAPTAHRDEAACPQQSPAHAELQPETAGKQSKGQAPGVKDDSASLKEAEFEESQQTAAQQTALARKQKAARRKAAKNKDANLQTKPSAGGSRSSTPGQLLTEGSSGAGDSCRKGPSRSSKRKACHAATQD